MEAAPHHSRPRKEVMGGGGGDTMLWYPEKVYIAADRVGAEAARQDSRGGGARVVKTLVTRKKLAWEAKTQKKKNRNTDQHLRL